RRRHTRWPRDWSSDVCSSDLHEPGRTGLLGLASFELPRVEDMIELTITLGRRTNPAIRCGGLSFNTSAFSDEQAERLMADESEQIGRASGRERSEIQGGAGGG